MLTTQDESLRLEALERYEILDTPPDGSFDRIARIAAKIFNMPIAIISLVDHDRIWFKSHPGMDIQEVGRDPGLCASAIFSDDVYVVEDAKSDPRTLTNPLVAGNFGLQFYAATQLKTHDGYGLGTLCLMDKKKRYINEDQKELLRDLGALVMDQLEHRLAARKTVESFNEQILDLERQRKSLREKFGVDIE